MMMESDDLVDFSKTVCQTRKKTEEELHVPLFA